MIDILPTDDDADLRPRIKVIGVGGAGGNAINNMIRANLDGVEFLAVNTDAQALRCSQADHKLQLGRDMTKGLGAGSKPNLGRDAAQETLNDIQDYLADTHMVFITAGMGGGTGTGAAPVIAETAREAGVLTVGVVTKPFHFEGAHRMRVAEAGIEALQSHVDTLIVIPNQNLFRIATEKTTFADAFRLADDVLRSGVRGVTDLMTMPGLINLDFADIRSVMAEMGKAMMGTGEASGERRALEAAEAAISNPLLDDVSMRGAGGVLVNITGGMDITLFEVDEAANRIREEVDPEANIIFGSTFDQDMEGTMRVSLVATGIDAGPARYDAPQAAPSTRASATVHAGPGSAANAATPEAESAPETPEPVQHAAAHAEPAAATGTDGAQATPGHAAGAGGGLDMGPGNPAPGGGAGHGDTFVAPSPKRGADFRTGQAGDGGTASRSAGAAVPSGSTGEASSEGRRRGPSLFQRVTGLDRSRSPEAEDGPARSGAAAQPATGAGNGPQAPSAAAGEAEPATQGEQGELGGLDDAQRPRQSQASQQDNLLDIPAFLRRQAN